MAFLIVIILASFLVWYFIRPTGYVFQRKDLDSYVEKTHMNNILDDGASVYFDMSDGMLDAYRSEDSRLALQSIINKFAANEAIDFFKLADGKITELNLNHTALYSYMLNRENYQYHQAPIEKTLDSIINKEQPALLMTDFEEYHGGQIHKAAYAKKYFIDWLAKGYNITFYKWSFVEGGVNKYMFLAVFDDNKNRLNNLVETALSGNQSVTTFVLGGRDFAYPTTTNYISSSQGGNYHNSDKKDLVTSVLEDGGKHAYCCYAKTIATAEGTGKFASLDNLIGPLAEYYPIGVSWSDALKNSRSMPKSDIKDENRFTHLLSNLYINFNAQDGYNINRIEIRTFDMQETMASMNDPISISDLELIDKPEINDIFVVDMEDDDKDWKHIFVDFHANFNGNFVGISIEPTDLIRANIVISGYSINYNDIEEFFKWDNNPSLVNSVKEALESATSKPDGRILYTYYVKTIAN